MANEIPVYLFVGFLESGKTKFIQETFEDPNFDSGDKTLLLVCEEGEEEYNQKKFAFPGVTLYNLEDKAELNPQNLAKLAKEADAREMAPRSGPVALAQGLGHKGTAPGADHHAHGGQNHDGGEDQVHGGERRFAGVVRHEEPVHDGVARGEDHHGDGGQREPYEGAGGEMFGHID